MKKILFIIWSYSLGGGAEALLTSIVNHLNPKKYQIGIIEFYHSTVKKEPVNSNIKIYGPITFQGDKEYHKKLYYTYREPDRMVRKYIPSGYDLYVSFNYQIPSFLLPEGTRNIAWIHTAVFDLSEPGMEDYYHMQENVFERTARIVSISDMTTRSLNTLFLRYADKIVEICNGLDIGKIQENADSCMETTLEHPALLYVGRLEERKNPLRMLNIFHKAFEKNSSLHLYFLGKGELESQVKERADEYGLNEYVHFFGYMENPFPIIKQADVCCMTSKAEGFPMCLLESAALGVPFVSTQVGGAEILTNGNRCGRVYKTDEEAVAQILELLNLPKDHIEKECERSISRFSLDNYISKIETLFDEVLKEKCESENKTKWYAAGDKEILEDRTYYYRFSEELVSKNTKIILYGAGNIGTDYYHYIKETECCRIAAWVDAAAEKYRNSGKDVRKIEDIMDLEYDAVLIAVMNEAVAKSICTGLCKMGVAEEKILWVKPIF